VYVPEYFRETRVELLQAFITRHPLATLIAMTSRGLTANHIPVLGQLDAQGGGVLRGHIARGNSLWRELTAQSEVLAVFVGADAYVSPNWYPSKREHGKVVPTWNYAAVHVSGRIRFTDDAAWLRELVTALTDTHEQAQPAHWQVSDAPPDYVGAMLRAIVGFEVTVSQVVGKFKSSQNRPAADRAAVAAAFEAAGRSAAELEELAPQ
jgi:transcriptional regulator